MQIAVLISDHSRGLRLPPIFAAQAELDLLATTRAEPPIWTSVDQNPRRSTGDRI